MDSDFQVSGKSGVMKGLIMSCGNYGADGKGTGGFDFVSIPAAVKAAMLSMPVPERICGQSKGLVTADMATAAKTICSKSAATSDPNRAAGNVYEWIFRDLHIF